MGILAAVITKGLAGKAGRGIKPADFIPTWDRQPQSWQDQLALVRNLNKAFGGSVKGVE